MLHGGGGGGVVDGGVEGCAKSSEIPGRVMVSTAFLREARCMQLWIDDGRVGKVEATSGAGLWMC